MTEPSLAPSLPPRRLNRWVIPALILGFLGLGDCLLALLGAFDIPYMWLEEHDQFLAWNIAHSVLGTLGTIVVVAAAMAATAAIVQIRLRPATDRGAGLAWVALALAFFDAIVPGIIWFTSAVFELVNTV